MSSPSIRKYLLDSLTGTSYDIAKVVYHMCMSRYVCGRLKNKLWFHFDGKRWSNTEIGPIHEISTDVFEEYQILLEEANQEYQALRTQREGVSTVDSDAASQTITSHIAKLVAIMTKLKNVNSKEAICRECLYLFYDPDFIQKLDRQTHVIPFRDVVWDAEKKAFRDYQYEDYAILYIDEDHTEQTPDTEEFVKKVEAFHAFREEILVKRLPRSLYRTRTFH